MFSNTVFVGVIFTAYCTIGSGYARSLKARLLHSSNSSAIVIDKLFTSLKQELVWFLDDLASIK